MTTTLSDTSPDAMRVLVELLRDAPAWRKAQMVEQMTLAVRQLALVGLRTRHPEEREEQVRRRLADLLLGPELARRAYGPADEP